MYVVVLAGVALAFAKKQFDITRQIVNDVNLLTEYGETGMCGFPPDELAIIHLSRALSLETL